MVASSLTCARTSDSERLPLESKYECVCKQRSLKLLLFPWRSAWIRGWKWRNALLLDAVLGRRLAWSVFATAAVFHLIACNCCSAPMPPTKRRVGSHLQHLRRLQQPRSH
ncbi:hypothetical protein IE81DRAFT_10054 [Ceraceosorus guamensis]|uniref:Uncharacterized protein n=1 Tax=Ceraceosorus guamensis TaxID=1522189 RepID=A0A316W3Y6_9BASI|nr:hypothetical protein IE81DRAFT_10054 [Ceraceosorus guamensis]PWN44540.1 hypothetical protein IE81DRAFT_10054 [Ceraceosorus guamensis]